MTLEFITHKALEPFQHGFFTRLGGASSGVFEGLNCGRGSTDQSDVVETNRARVAEAMQLPLASLVSVHQYHSADVIEIDGPLDDITKADGMVSGTENVTLGILTADCQPVLFADAKAKIIGAAHAGWMGALSGVLENTIEAMVTLGAKRDAIRAVIGPCISQRAYEVGPEFFERFIDEDPQNSRFFSGGQSGKMQFDLPGYGLSRLRGAGVDAEWTGHCTYSDPRRFYSFRRATHAGEADYGRLIATIRI